uniref:Uncharacterized protein n=1 Tax=Medicago truncatula TaxID=3880 RepID=A2Q1Y0_MEDTR|nr:hypothetical protein MtrDRAFT_AC149130g54v2 [Medicago truncatula]
MCFDCGREDAQKSQLLVQLGVKSRKGNRVDETLAVRETITDCI